ncbi:Holliday junction branch migration protein RuvA [Streptacidiphilus pinicola]|uniref:Holliday junction branch migration complex subunit RuvA n=1 Tax=Streptacidiphilus pinicola TaxID=2219663 RepID=A0A2X0IEP4_9ACTN|nr:Holliday junction branch migration protein RuvA [Streptacidiphilus pinicola]RAG83492.1 Holliday junction branch migration protein RuvA [Streptacidiphilus pinicola]
MIAFVSGPVAAFTPSSAVIQVGGVGMLVHCAPGTLARLRLGEETRLATSLVVREDSLTLYGFADDDERQTFELLQTASGVGPKVAQAMLAVHSPEALRVAVARGDAKALTAVPGIGPKGAQKLLLELKDRLGAPTGAVPSQHAAGPVAAAPAPWHEQLHAALVGLGFAPREAEEAVVAVTPEAETMEKPNVSALLRTALQSRNRTR